MKPKLVFLIALVAGLAAPQRVRAGESAPAAGAASTNAAGIESTRSTVGKWIATQNLVFQEKKDWQEEQELLEARLDALAREIAASEAKLAESQGVLGELRQKRADTSATEHKLIEGTNRLAEAVIALEADVRRLHPLLPASVKEKVDPLYRRIPEDPHTTRISAGERFQNVVGILNEIHKANAEISLVTEIRALSDGKPSEVKTVYVGLGQAYFLSARGEAGVGRPTEAGWEWRAANELAPNVTEVIEILENKGKPKFVALPVTLE